MLTIAALIPEIINRHLGLWLFGLCIAAGLVVGFKDILRLSAKRIWAISGVCFDESIRRRVLWITPLAILGVFVVSQLQRPIDEQDAIRQTIKFCLFATGLLVAITTIILACTNLPREIENRVIYTVVTKPTTRLEIVFGKIIGFARVSFVILFIMGLFTWGYLSARAWTMRRAIAQRLEGNEAPSASTATLKYYLDAGLLNSKTLEEPDMVQVFARNPADTGFRRYMFGNGEGSFLVPYNVTPAEITPPGEEPGQNGLIVFARLGYVRKGTSGSTGTSTGASAIVPTTRPVAATAPTTVPYYGPFIVSPEERSAMMSGTKQSTNPTVSIDVLDANQNSIGAAVPVGMVKTLELLERTGLSEVRAIIEPKIAQQLKGRIYIRVTGNTPDVEYYVDLEQTPLPVALAMPVSNQQLVPLKPTPSALDPSKPAAPIFQSRIGSSGMQLRGGTEGTPIAIFRFRDAKFSGDGNAPFEFRAGIERSGADEPEMPEADTPARVALRVKNIETGAISDELNIQPESNRTVFFTVPAQFIGNGNFDVLMQCLTKGDHIGLKPRSLVMITRTQTFASNLVKSLLILWLMSILITAVSIFCSTFLSWPIAVVLTIVILLGHWGVQQLGDSIAPGIGNQIVTDFGLKSPAKAEAVGATVEKLSSFLNFISTILPDISKFPAVEDIERGVSIPMVKLIESLFVTLGFGLPLSLLAYVFLKNKEVAP